MERYYVLEPGTYLRKDGESLLVMRGNEAVGRVPLEGLEQLVLVGSSLSGAVVQELVRRRVETVLLSPWGQFRGRLVVDEHKHVARRKAQYLAFSDPRQAVHIARRIVQAKLKSGARFLSRRAGEYGLMALRKTAAQMMGLARMVAVEENMEMVRGLEGRGAHLYFEVFKDLVRAPGFHFSGRTKRPPRDPINALLSFVYTLLTNEVLTAVKIVGLDPYLGTLHTEEYGRPSLACDLVEEWRTHLGDRLVLGLINRRVVTPEDFVERAVTAADGVDEEDLRAHRPVEMKPKIARAFVDAYERWMGTSIQCPFAGTMSTYRGLIRDQARRFLRFLMGEAPTYEPFPWWTL
ncbi:CRISPR-associated endonuclease Cas1 [Desulfosoma caldarium]|uniref:CRISPR-associated endonuclease Cas1 n=1 Tax=Desulfosoma caldarium TaxID=610254 RepID=A0A3N1UPP2_9BACT|nr:CRISPR-associated endonuclease Cas1 [Desulfosoma caldarium]ROQ92053.1 CRISPR-associated Cas1 family protein [Desulfosoma caldarium]